MRPFDQRDSPFSGGWNTKQMDLSSNQAVAKRKGELFRRMKCTTLARLLKHVQSQESAFKEDREFDDLASMASLAPSDSPSMISSNAEAILRNQDTEFVVLDLRDPEEFRRSHIYEALNFPAHLIMRDRFPMEIYRLRNVPQKYIVVYAFDERPGVDAAQRFVQRGYENIYLLTGGLEEFMKQFPKYVEGFVPPLEETKRSTFGGFSTGTMRK